ncbi:phosphopantetheine-binding protein [Paludisphaera mucosa]|uniref:Phosphopantetheine-binding protein n=1 Tax=Paludisphaera mucosa TaxID=3030827 RepID=A0ABT6FD08_9BACT|nr:phosphopantetheine-binding protein [Paludisphaera mucosa]MDG3005417.1 phosphopantetheine-binding protein [Paludisphaera mucosa]
MTLCRDIHAKVGSILAASLGVDEADVIPSATLQGQLGAESIDFLDIVFRLERGFGIKILQGELFPDSILGGRADLFQEGRVTDLGMVELRSRMPYADLDDLERDRRLGSVADLFTVGLVVRYVEWKLGRDGRTVTVDRADPLEVCDPPSVHQPLSPGR